MPVPRNWLKTPDYFQLVDSMNCYLTVAAAARGTAVKCDNRGEPTLGDTYREDAKKAQNAADEIAAELKTRKRPFSD